MAYRLKAAHLCFFAFGLAVFVTVPSEIGRQDISGLIARQPGVKERWQKHFIASPFGTIHAATFSFLRPIGTHVPEVPAFRLASLTTSDPETGDSAAIDLSRIVFPAVDRTLKGDRLPAAEEAPSVEQAAEPAPAPALQPPNGKTKAASAPVDAPLDPELEAALQSDPLPQYEGTTNDASLAALQADNVEASIDPQPQIDNFKVKNARLFFGGTTLGPQIGALQRWEPGEAPVIVGDPDMKKLAALPAPDADANEKPGETVAGKGAAPTEVKRPKSPAERLMLDGKQRAKAEKCLTDAVYFESRGESVRGQIAVAQVVMNRVFSRFYPDNVCGVVYQNAHRRLACQFTFACDGIRDVVKEPDMWERAKKIARETLDGRLWLPEVGKSTHYHAYWVRPSWTRQMHKLYKVGVHTFYRPRNWGDGSDMPQWSTPAITAEVAAKL